MATITLTKLSGLSGHDVVSSCLPGGSHLFFATGVSGAEAVREVRIERVERSERPTQAPAVAAVAAAQASDAYDAIAAAAANGAGAAAVAANQLFGQQKTQLHTMWALRGLKPWMHPA
ncbi:MULTISPECIES: hypothetical protein [unclassified Streptomyces]|uniref:hypothetical protein n=1 Tax=unclassified Streptomyces TaxID=2593676 RepID=UPI001903CD85|nr:MULTISPECIES: hypothetical protein [unclassified Streptomyces]MCU4746814.1 hypothetical protein [Streptomyces sp. G-5]QQN77520.1 hypothetical protein IPZ77_08705 [Streptomyces sp. XC 2026]